MSGAAGAAAATSAVLAAGLLEAALFATGVARSSRPPQLRAARTAVEISAA
jgi:hypothetical protein